MSFSRTHLFNAIQWDVNNLNFKVFVPTPGSSPEDILYGDGSEGVYFNDHKMPNKAYAYLDRDLFYTHADRGKFASIGLYDAGTTEGTFAGKMPPNVHGHPGMASHLVFTNDAGESFTPGISPATLSPYGTRASEVADMTETYDTLRFGSAGDSSAMFKGITSVKVDGTVNRRMLEIAGIDAFNEADLNKFTNRLRTFTSVDHNIWPGWTWSNDDENSFLRGHIIWAPYKRQVRRSLSTEFYNKPFEGLYRLFNAIPIGPPHRDHHGFYSRFSDFHCLITYRIYGYSVDTGGVKKLHPLVESPSLGGDSNMIVTEALLGNNPPKPYDVNIPSTRTYQAFINFLQPSADEINRFRMSSTGEVHKFYSGVPWGTFSTTYGFAYNVVDQSWNTFGAEDIPPFSKVFSIHPRNPYAGSFRGGDVPGDTDESRPKKYEGFLYEPDAFADEDDALSESISADSRLYYKHMVDQFKDAGSGTTNVNENRYDVAFVKSGRFGPNNGLAKPAGQVLAEPGYNSSMGKSFMTYMNPKKVDALSTHIMAHKLFSPRPLNGEALRAQIPFNNSVEIYQTFDENTWPNIQAEPDSEQHGRLTDHQKSLNANVRAHLTTGRYRMYWSNAVSDSQGALDAEIRDKRSKVMYYGRDTLTLAGAFMKLGKLVVTLNKMWTYDDTPKEARIRMQENGKIDKGIFSSITDSSLDMEMEEAYTEFLGRQMLQDRVLSLGGTFTEGMVREAEAEMGVETGTYDSRIGTATELGSGRGDY